MAGSPWPGSTWPDGSTSVSIPLTRSVTQSTTTGLSRICGASGSQALTLWCSNHFFQPSLQTTATGWFLPKNAITISGKYSSSLKKSDKEYQNWRVDLNPTSVPELWTEILFGRHSFDVPPPGNWKYQNEYSSYLVFLGVRNSDVGGYQVFRTDPVTAPYIILALLNTTRCASDTHCSVDHAMQGGDWNIKNDLFLRAIIEMSKLASKNC